MRRLSWVEIAGYALLVLAVLGVLLLVIGFFESIPPALIGTLAIDWRALYAGLAGGQLRYGTGLLNPPWAALFVLPLGWLSLPAGWGVLVFVTLLVEIVSVPRVPQRWRYYVAILLLVTSFHSLRHLADGNFEALTIAGVCLTLWGLKRAQTGGGLVALVIGLLLTSAKPQSVFLFLLVLGVYILWQWPPRDWLRLAGGLALVIVPTLLWKGSEWLNTMFAIRERGSLMDINITAALTRLEQPLLAAVCWLLLAAVTLWLVWRARQNAPLLTREMAGMLVAASLLLAPYSAGNSLLSVLAIGVIPLFLRRWLPGLALILLLNSAAFFNRPQDVTFSATYTTLLLLTCWGVLAWQTWQTHAAANKSGA
ncbi:MAG: DUF2029 domain-containing protein [Chloroflexi bacterium]|nr:DUF2029 domain-containing protein [Chloroflexota bacterium]